MLLHVGYYALHLLHLGVMLFTLTGWYWDATRSWHLAMLAAIALSWFGLGFWFGWGYCFLTDWHWQIRRALGDPPAEFSYVGYLLRLAFGRQAPPGLVNGATIAAYFGCCLLSAWQFARRQRDTQAEQS